MAPAPMATTTSAASSGVAKPSVINSGAMMPALVVMATVELPCAVLRMAASRNGKSRPRLSSVAAWAVMKLTRSVVAITLPSTPPAAVTNRMGPTVLRVSSVRA